MSTRARRGAAALAAAGACAGGAALLAHSASGTPVPSSVVKPLDNNVWVVRGRINPDTQRFCARDIASIVPAGPDIYVICDSHGRLAPGQARAGSH